MLGCNPSEPALFQMEDVGSLVPANHRLRKIDVVLDLSSVPEVVAECYSANRGRPSIDPELALRMMLLGVLRPDRPGAVPGDPDAYGGALVPRSRLSRSGPGSLGALAAAQRAPV